MRMLWSFIMRHWILSACLVLAVVSPTGAASLFGTIAAIILGGYALSYIGPFAFLGFLRQFLSTGILAAVLFFAAGYIGKAKASLFSQKSSGIAVQPAPRIDDPTPSVGLPDRIRERADVVQPLYERPGLLSLLGCGLGAAFGWSALLFWRHRAGATPSVRLNTHPSIVASLRRGGRWDGYAIEGQHHTETTVNTVVEADPSIIGRTALGKPIYRKGLVVPSTADAAIPEGTGRPEVIGMTALGRPIHARTNQPKITLSRVKTQPGQATKAAYRATKIGVDAKPEPDEDIIVVDVNSIELLRGTPKVAELLA